MGSTAAVKVLNLVPLSGRITDGPDGEVDVEDEALLTNKEREGEGRHGWTKFPEHEKGEEGGGLKRTRRAITRLPSP